MLAIPLAQTKEALAARESGSNLGSPVELAFCTSATRMLNPSSLLSHRRMPSRIAVMLEIPEGDDIIDALRSYAVGRRFANLSILSASGLVSDVRLRQPGSVPSATPRVLSGCFDIASFSGIFHLAGTWSLSVSLATPDGTLLGGVVAEPLRAAGPVVVAAATLGLNYVGPSRRDRGPSIGGNGPALQPNPPPSISEELRVAAEDFRQHSRRRRRDETS